MFADQDIQPFIDAFAKRVKALRKEHDITQLDLAAKIGIDERQIQRIEAGRVNTSIGNAHLMAQAFGISLPDLFDFDTDLSDHSSEKE